MRQWIIFDKKPLTEYGLYISGGGTFNAPQRDVESLEMPGRNGELTIDKGRYLNIDVEYPAFICRDFSDNLQSLRNWLLTRSGYKVLQDTYHPDEYRLARYLSGLEVTPSQSLREGEFSLVFNCKPQRFLRRGDQAITFTASGVIKNPTLTIAKPMVRVYGTGTITINGISIQITTNASYTDIDCETENAYRGSTNLNGNIALNANHDFWSLSPGSNTVTLGTGITRVEIKPRWWVL